MVAAVLVAAACGDDGGGSAAVDLDLHTVLQALCVDAGGAPDALFEPFTVRSGPAADAFPPAMNSGDPALEIVHVGMRPGGCAGERLSVVVAELGGPADQIHLALAVDSVPGAGWQAIEFDPLGTGQIDGWDAVLTVTPDGTSFYRDAARALLDGPVQSARVGRFVALGVPRPGAGTEVTYHFQVMRLSAAKSTASRDWRVASGSSRVDA